MRTAGRTQSSKGRPTRGDWIVLAHCQYKTGNEEADIYATMI